MKKVLYVLTMLACVFAFTAVSEAASFDVPSNLRIEYSISGGASYPLADGGTITVDVGDSINFGLFATGVNQYLLDTNASGDETVTVTGSVTPDSVTGLSISPLLVGLGSVSVGDRVANTTIVATEDPGAPVLLTFSIEYKSSRGTFTITRAVNVVIRIRAILTYYPTRIIFTDTDYKPLSRFVLEAQKNREIYLVVDDYNKDGVIDSNDYSRGEVELIFRTIGDISVSTGTYSLPNSLTGVFPRLFGRVTVTATQVPDPGEQGYDDRYATLACYYDGQDDANISPTLTITLRSRDDATGDYNDGGGSCDVLGLGALALALPLLFLRKKSA